MGQSWGRSPANCLSFCPSLVTYSWGEEEVLGASGCVLEAGHLAVLWLMLPCLSTIAAGRMELRPKEELLVVGETAGSDVAWEKGDPKALSSSVVLGGSAERP